MKKIIAALLIASFSFNSFAQFSLSCPEIYQRIVQKKEARKSSSNVSSGAGAVFIAVPVTPVSVGIFVGIGALLAYKSYANGKEMRAIRISNEDSRQFNKFVKKLQKKINPDITADEVHGIVEEGFNDGVYCQNFPDLYTEGDIKRHVKNILVERYPKEAAGKQ